MNSNVSIKAEGDDEPVIMTENRKRLGYWLSQKKCKKLSFYDIESALRKRNIEPVKIDLEKSLQYQGPFHGLLHKLTDFIALAEIGDTQAQNLIHRVQSFVQDNPSTIVIDSIECLQILINRYKTYCVIAESQLFQQQDTVFIPPFVELRQNEFESNKALMRKAGIQFPAVCKPVVAHGSSSAHEMTLIFNMEGLTDVKYPCVVQTFINHNATLYKLFCLGTKTYTTVLRPSIRNFKNTEDNYKSMAPIQFDGGDVSKAKPTSELAIQGNYASNGHRQNQPCPKLLSAIVANIGDCMGLRLFGVDVIVEAGTGRLAVVDVNAFPGYEGVDDFPEKLADFVQEELENPSRSILVPPTSTFSYRDDVGIKYNCVTEPNSLSSERLT